MPIPERHAPRAPGRTTGAAGSAHTARERLTAVVIVCGMVLGSVGLWIGNPYLWLWVTGRLQTTQPSMGPYLAMILGILGTAIACAKWLSMLNRRYAVVMGDNTVNVHLPWIRGLGGEHEKRLQKVTVLDVVMVLSVVTATVALIAWFIIVKPTPPGVGPGPAKG